MTQEAKKVSIKGHELSCPVCKHDLFYKRTGRRDDFVSMISFLRKEFVLYECENCTHILWFNSWINPFYE